MTKIALVIILIIIGLVAFLLLKPAGPTNNPNKTISWNNSPTSASPQVTELAFPLNTQNNSHELGQVKLTASGVKTMVHIDLKGGPTTSQPAHIHLGACPSPGVVKYPLSPVSGGVSDTLLNISLDTLKQNLPLAINVHKSDADMKTYVACGDIKL